MKIEVNRKNLIKAMGIAATFSGRNKSMPVLNSVKVRVTGNSMRITSFDGENAVSYATEVKTEGDNAQASFCIEPSLVTRYISCVKSEDISMDIDMDSSIMKIVHEGGSTKVHIEGSEMFPDVPKEEKVASFVVDTSVFKDLIARGKYFLKNDLNFPILSSAYFAVEGDAASFCCTDSLRMYTDRITVTSTSDCHCLIPYTAFPVISMLENQENTSVIIGKRTVTVRNGSLNILTRNMEGGYPNFKALLPDSSPINVKVSQTELESAVKRCKLSASATTELVKVYITENSIKLLSEDLEMQKSAEENIACESNGSITVALKASSFQDAIAACPSSDIILGMSSAESPVIIRCGEDSDTRILIMPMRVH